MEGGRPEQEYMMVKNFEKMKMKTERVVKESETDKSNKCKREYENKIMPKMGEY